MGYVALYWGFMLLGYFFGSKLRKHQEKLGFINGVMLVCISLLVLLMGIRMGANEEVIRNLGSIGVQALIITVLLMAGAVLSVTVARKLLGMDKHGFLKIKGCPSEAGLACGREAAAVDTQTAAPPKGEETQKEEGGGNSNLMSWMILISVAAGLLAGYFVVGKRITDIDAFDSLTGWMMTAGLCVLLHVIGIDMGVSGTVVKQLKNIGPRIIAFPVAVVLGTTVTAVLIGLVFDNLTVRESLAISYGFGWYTFAPITITNAGHVVAGAVSFMHNVFREMSGIVLIPVLAKYIGYIEVTALTGVAGMDICLPIVERATRQEIIVYSFAIGVVESFLVPFLTPLALGA